MSSQIKITEEELKQVLELREKIRTNVETLGRLSVRRHFANLELHEIDAEIDQTHLITEDLSAEENRIVKEISQKYGDGSLDFETGIYTPKNS